MKSICIIGSGSWGVALGIHLSKQNMNVKIWSFSEEEKNKINNERKCVYLPDIELPQNIYCTTSYEEAIEGTETVLIVTPSKVVRENVKKFKNYITNQQIIMCSKGLEDGTLCTLTDILKEEMPDVLTGVLSGPSHAEEVALGIPTAVVIASEHDEVLDNLQSLFMTDNFRVYTSRDVIGVEVGGAIKNIIAFCAGVAAGLNLGDNTFAALVTRGLAEITRLGMKMGGEQSTFYGLTGLGDLIVTCGSMHSRNRRAGMLIGQGKSVEEAQKEIGMTIESIDNVQIAYKLAKKYEVETPIIRVAYEVLFNSLDPKEAVTMLMTRGKKEEY